jgi:hypothetical protein
MVRVNGTELYKYIKEQSKDVEFLEEKEILLALFAAQHLQGYHEFHSGTGTAATGVGLAMSFFNLNPAFTAMTIVAGCFGALTAFYNINRTMRINKLIDVFSGELLKRYDNILDAYIEIKSMIQKIEKEEILEYFNRVNK